MRISLGTLSISDAVRDRDNFSTVPQDMLAFITGSRGRERRSLFVKRDKLKPNVLNAASHLPDMVAHVFIFKGFSPLFCLKAVIYGWCTDKNLSVLGIF